MQLFVRGSNLNVLNVNGDENVDRLKQQIAVLEGIPVDDQVLFFGGKPLEGCGTLAESDIQDACTLDVVGRVLGGLLEFLLQDFLVEQTNLPG